MDFSILIQKRSHKNCEIKDIDTQSSLLNQGRKRTNLLKKYEAKLIYYLCSKTPSFITPNKLTMLGVLGGLIVLMGMAASFYTGSSFFLVFSILGLAVNWLGDSLDGRIAYFRNVPRKWYGWALDLSTDWIVTFFISLGFFIYTPENPSCLQLLEFQLKTRSLQ